MPDDDSKPSDHHRARAGAEEFPLMIVISCIYPCNFGCPNCPYTDENSEIRKFYHERNADRFPVDLWENIADEAGEYGAWLRCTGGGEPILHPHMVDMIEYAKTAGARVWLNTNSSRFGPKPKDRQKLERLLRAGIDLIEFSMDAGDAETHAVVRPPLGGGPPKDPEKWWSNHLDNVRSALALRAELSASSRIVVSIICQDIIRDRLDQAVDFWLNDVGVDDVITRKFLNWDDNTAISLNNSSDPHLYRDLPTENKEPCVWPFERLNIDTLGRIALCGQDISFKTAELFPNARDSSIKEIWQGEQFNQYRRLHLAGKGAEAWPCRNCSAWLAGIRDWEYGWLRVLETSGDHLKEVMSQDLGAEVAVFDRNKSR